ncbi:MAG: phosphoribosylanthranilate isomerase [Acidimicrobiales bacterium]
MFVKICGITRPADAVAAARVGADAIGLNFVPASSRRIDHDTARAIIEATPDHVQTVGVYRRHSTAEIIESVERHGLDAAQLHDATPEQVAAVAAAVPRTILALDARRLGSLDFAVNAADIIMLDGPDPGSGTSFDWTKVGALTSDHRILLAGGLRPENVADAIRLVRPWGVDVATGVEVSPGEKDHDVVARFITAARDAGSDASNSRENERTGKRRSSEGPSA